MRMRDVRTDKAVDLGHLDRLQAGVCRTGGAALGSLNRRRGSGVSKEAQDGAHASRYSTSSAGRMVANSSSTSIPYCTANDAMFGPKEDRNSPKLMKKP